MTYDKITLTHNLVTIILINRNHGHTISQTIDSFAKQSADNLTILCIDGGSTDNSLSTLQEYKYIRVVSEPDKSGSEALVKGIKLSSSKYIMFATSNDVLLDVNFIQDSVNLMEEDKSISCVFGKVLGMTNEGVIGVEVPPYLENCFGDYAKNFLQWLKHGNSFHECATLFRRDTVLNCLPELDSFAQEIENLREDLTLSLRYEFFRNGYKSQFLNLNTLAVRDHKDRGSIINSLHFRRHLDFYNYQIINFRKNFLLNRKFVFRNPDKTYSDKLSAINIFISCAYLLYLNLRGVFGKLKRFLLKNFSFPIKRGDERI